MQLTHYNSKFDKRLFPITLLCDHVTNAPNVGSLFRIADAFGVEKIIFCGKHVPVTGRRMTKTSRATEKTVDYELVENSTQKIDKLQEAGYTIIALEITNTSKSIHTMDFSAYKKLVLVVGAEDIGVNHDILEKADLSIHIDMFGKNSSMNVVQATNIVLYEITKQWTSGNV